MYMNTSIFLPILYFTCKCELSSIYAPFYRILLHTETKHYKLSYLAPDPILSYDHCFHYNCLAPRCLPWRDHWFLTWHI